MNKVSTSEKKDIWRFISRNSDIDSYSEIFFVKPDSDSDSENFSIRDSVGVEFRSLVQGSIHYRFVERLELW